MCDALSCCLDCCTRTSDQQIVDILVSKVVEFSLEVVKVVPQDPVSERAVELIVDVPAPHVMTEILKVAKFVLQVVEQTFEVETSLCFDEPTFEFVKLVPRERNKQRTI